MSPTESFCLTQDCLSPKHHEVLFNAYIYIFKPHKNPAFYTGANKRNLLDRFLDFLPCGYNISRENSVHIDVILTFLHQLLPHLLQQLHNVHSRKEKNPEVFLRSFMLYKTNVKVKYVFADKNLMRRAEVEVEKISTII